MRASKVLHKVLAPALGALKETFYKTLFSLRTPGALMWG